MISPERKAAVYLEVHGESAAIVQATQCMVSAPMHMKDYWWSVIELIKYHGKRYNQIQKGG
jgi:hypothetical protein